MYYFIVNPGSRSGIGKVVWQTIDEILEQPAQLSPDHREVLEAVLSLPQKYRDVVYLHYFEDYTAPQISRILGKNVNTIYTLLTRSKRMLREKLGGDGFEW